MAGNRGLTSDKVALAAKEFQFVGELVHLEPYGNGHINDTFALTYQDGAARRRYVLQRINTDVFKKPVELMENISNVINHISEKLRKSGGDHLKECLNIIPTNENAYYLFHEDTGYWRAYIFIEDAIAYDLVENKELFRESAVAFGRFQKQLADFPAHTLHESIPNFHNTVSRLEALEAAIARDAAGRVSEVAEEIQFALTRKPDAAFLVDLLAQGRLPLRVTHNDTKLNNVLIDAVSGKAICVIDLDTVMPGLSVYDFGDSIRFGASTSAEDEKDLSKTSMSLELFQIYTEGFLSEAGNALSDLELDCLPDAAKIMTYECGIRFLADYLNGDIYFKTSYSEHNLVRCRTQFKLVSDMEQKMAEMRRIVSQERAKASSD